MCEVAKKQLATWGLSDRVDTVAGDFVKDPWPTGYDVVSLTRMMNSRTIEVINKLFKKAYDVLPSGGKLIIVHTPMLGAERGHYGFLQT